MKRIVIAGIGASAVGLAVASAAIVASTAASSAAAAPASAVSYVLHFKGATSGPQNPHPGDTLTSKSVVYNSTDTTRKGRTSELCTETVGKPFTMQCSMTLLLGKAGTLTVAGGINPTSTPWTAAIVGGTGNYAGARGTVRVSSLSGQKERWRFTFTQ